MQFSFIDGQIHMQEEQQDPNQQLVRLPIPGVVLAVVHRQRAMLFDIRNLPGGAFIDQQYDDTGAYALWTNASLQIFCGDKTKVYPHRQAFSVDAPNDPLLMAYMGALATKMGYQ